MPKKGKRTPLRASDSVSIDTLIAHARSLDQDLRAAAAAWKNFSKRVLIPLARREGYRKGDSYLLKGAHNDALISRVLDVLITDQAEPMRLPEPLRSKVVITLFKPTDNLKRIVRNSRIAWADLRDDYGTRRAIERFIARAVESRRYWRVAKLTVRNVGASANQAGRTVPARPPRAQSRGRRAA